MISPSPSLTRTSAHRACRILAAHTEPVSSGIKKRDNIAFFHNRQHPVLGEDIAGLAYRPNNCIILFFGRSRFISHNRMMYESYIVGRTRRLNPASTPTKSWLPFYSINACQKDRGISNYKTPRLKNEFRRYANGFCSFIKNRQDRICMVMRGRRLPFILLIGNPKTRAHVNKFEIDPRSVTFSTSSIILSRLR